MKTDFKKEACQSLLWAQYLCLHCRCWAHCNVLPLHAILIALYFCSHTTVLGSSFIRNSHSFASLTSSIYTASV